MALVLPDSTAPKTGGASLSHPRAIPQKQPGLYAVAYHPIGGMLSGKNLPSFMNPCAMLRTRNGGLARMKRCIVSI